MNSTLSLTDPFTGARAAQVAAAALKGAKALSAADALNAAGHVIAMSKGDGGSKNWRDYLDKEDCPSFEKMPAGDNIHFKQQYDEALRQLGIEENSDEARRFHDDISKKGLTDLNDLIEAGKELGYGKHGR